MFWVFVFSEKIRYSVMFQVKSMVIVRCGVTDVAKLPWLRWIYSGKTWNNINVLKTMDYIYIYMFFFVIFTWFIWVHIGFIKGKFINTEVN